MADLTIAPIRFFLAALVVLLLTLATGASTAEAVAFTVNSTVDAVDASPGDGICATVAGQCTLRAAIQEANALPGPDVITVPSGTYSLTLAGQDHDSLGSGDLDISGDLEIRGAGAVTTIIDGNRLDYVLKIESGSSTVSGVTVQGAAKIGVVNDATLTLNDSVVAANGDYTNGGSGITNTGVLTVNRDSIRGNRGATQGGVGGGIYNIGTATITDATISDNFADAGGGIENLGTIDMANVTVEGNSALAGGGLFNARGEATLRGVRVTGNTSIGPEGGGIDNRAKLTMENSTVSANASSNGISNFGDAIINLGDAVLTNSLVSTNNGAGIENGRTLTLTNVTVDGNGGEGLTNGATATLSDVTVSSNGDGGISNLGNAHLEVKGTILANNSNGNCGGSQPVTSDGHNLEDANTCGFTGPGDLVNTDPKLGPLADNGGPTQTRALLPGSPAIDAGSTDCPPPATDQRGVLRPQDGDGDGIAICDIGAYELQPPPGTPAPSPTSQTPTPAPTPTAVPSPTHTVEPPMPSPTPADSIAAGPVASVAALPRTGGPPGGNHGANVAFLWIGGLLIGLGMISLFLGFRRRHW